MKQPLCETSETETDDGEGSREKRDSRSGGRGMSETSEDLGTADTEVLTITDCEDSKIADNGGSEIVNA